MKNLFEAFDRGQLITPDKTVNFESVPWNRHPTFDGVELKHIVTASETNGEFSYCSLSMYFVNSLKSPS